MKLKRPLLRLPRNYSASELAKEVRALPADAWIAHPGRLAGNDAVPLITPGGEVHDGFSGPMAPTKYLDDCPYIRQIMADLDGVWGRSRLMGLAAGAVVPGHVDVGYYWRTHLRIHIPIITNPQVLFTCDGESVHMAAGECWVFDSFRMHNVQNRGSEKRIHLVLDTVGGEKLWDLVQAAQNAGDSDGAVEYTELKPRSAPTSAISYERENIPQTMSAWEVRCHVDHILSQTKPADNLPEIIVQLERFANGWMAAWAQFGDSGDGASRYHGLLDDIRQSLRRLHADRVLLDNDVPLHRALEELIFMVAAPKNAAPARQPVAARL